MIQNLLLSTQMILMRFIYGNIEEYNPNKNRKKWLYLPKRLLVCLVTKNLNPIVAELFIRGRKLEYLFFSCFYYPILFRCSKKYQTKFKTLFC